MLNYEDLIFKIKELNPIDSVVSEYVKLKKSGSSLKGLCPFHSEKTPSFFVHPQRGFFHCFGCGKGGDVITFIQFIENVDFKDAVEILARKSGIDIKSYLKTQERGIASIIFEVNRFACDIYHKSLKKNKNVLSYLEKRGLNEEDISLFTLGYADGERTLLKNIKESNLNIEDFVKAGLVIKNEDGKYREVFYNRIMFPIFSITGNILGFGGRVLGDELPKYVNTQQTPVYKKGDFLYGLNLSRKYISEENYAILVEGYMDFISLYKSGIKNIVAQLGTACTENQAKILKKFCEKVILMYDSDDAGQNATMRSIPILLKEGLIVEVYKNEKFKDPDELVKNTQKITHEFLNKDFVDIIKFSTDFFLKKEKDRMLSKKHLLTFLSSSINGIEDKSLKFLYRDMVKKELGFEVNLEESKGSKKIKDEKNDTGLVNVYVDIVSLMLVDKNLCKTFCSEIEEEDFLDLNLKGVFVSVCNSIEEKWENNVDFLLKNDKIINLKNKIIERMDYYSNNLPDEKKIKDILSILKRKKLERKIKEIETQIKNCTDEEERDRLLEIKILIQKKLKGGK
ncbi:MAG: DNA primase [candidate division WOR-3 bacterium]